MADSTWKDVPTVLIIREMQIKTARRCYLAPVRMANIKTTNIAEDMKKGSPCTPLVGM